MTGWIEVSEEEAAAYPKHVQPNGFYTWRIPGCGCDKYCEGGTWEESAPVATTSLTEQHPHLGDPDRRIIFIPAIPSSGTSLVAGLLHCLGVDLGRQCPPEDLRARGYHMYEDNDMNLFSSQYDDQKTWNRKEIIMERHIRMRDYINFRFIHNTETRVAFKAPATFWMLDPDPASLPLDVVDVRRDLEKSIFADQRTMATRTERDPSLSKPHYQHQILRAGSLGACFWARKCLLDIHKPVIQLLFENIIECPEENVNALVTALNLEPTDTQLENAVSFINPKMRHI
jgi:hypothetical protein